jgi:hypothetical protein
MPLPAAMSETRAALWVATGRGVIVLLLCLFGYLGQRRDHGKEISEPSIPDVRARPRSFEPPEGFDLAQHVLSGLATAPYRHEVTLLIQATAEQIRARLPASVANIEELPPADGADSGSEP